MYEQGRTDLDLDAWLSGVEKSVHLSGEISVVGEVGRHLHNVGTDAIVDSSSATAAQIHVPRWKQRQLELQEVARKQGAYAKECSKAFRKASTVWNAAQTAHNVWFRQIGKAKLERTEEARSGGACGRGKLGICNLACPMSHVPVWIGHAPSPWPCLIVHRPTSQSDLSCVTC